MSMEDSDSAKRFAVQILEALGCRVEEIPVAAESKRADLLVHDDSASYSLR